MAFKWAMAQLNEPAGPFSRETLYGIGRWRGKGQTTMDTYTQGTAASSSMPDQESASRMTDEAEAAKPGGMKLESVSVRQAANGGFIVTCNKVPVKQTKDWSPGESKDYAFASLEEAAQYMAQEFGSSPAAAASRPEGATRSMMV
jgi:hypothetical protein